MIKKLEYRSNTPTDIIDVINKLIDRENQREELEETYFEQPN